jgi:hypothetical protein
MKKSAVRELLGRVPTAQPPTTDPLGNPRWLGPHRLRERGRSRPADRREGHRRATAAECRPEGVGLPGVWAPLPSAGHGGHHGGHRAQVRSERRAMPALRPHLGRGRSSEVHHPGLSPNRTGMLRTYQ